MEEARRNILILYTSLVAYTTKKIVERRIIQKQERKRTRKTWRENWLRRRDEGRGMLNMLREELLLEDPDQYKNFLRMNNDCFNQLLNLIRPDIVKQNTHLRTSISAEHRLAVTLRYLAIGNTFRDLMFATRIHESIISLIVMEVCDAIISHLMHEFMKFPSSIEDWERIAADFYSSWNFPMCLVALDGKHINFQAPRSAGSFYYNYKGSHSIVLLALVDANYKFLYVDIGVNGRISDGGVFRESSLRKGIDRNILHIPSDSYLPGTNTKVPFVIVADDAFPLSNRLMKPYPQRGLSIEKRIFNYRLSRARRIVENAFGILVNRFRILHGTINLSSEKAEKITLACCLLHNFLSKHSKRYTEMDDEVCNLVSLSQQGGCHYSKNALDVRNKFCEYFNTIGKVSWQNKSIGIE